MPSTRHLLGAGAMAFWIGSQALGTACADPANGKPNGDSKSDLAPLDQSGHAADEGPMAHANTPPIGAATTAGGGNPKESGPVDAEKDAGTNTRSGRR